MSILAGLWHGLDEAFFMFWQTLWALVLGFALAGAVQAFVSRREMREALGDHRPVTLAKPGSTAKLSWWACRNAEMPLCSKRIAAV